MISVRLCSSIFLSVSLSISVHPSVICPSLNPHVLRSLSLSRPFADPVVHWNLDNFLSLLSHSSMLSQHLLMADRFCCVRACDCFWMSLYRRPDGTFGQATWHCLYKQRSPYRTVTSHCAQTGGPADRWPARLTATFQFNYNWQVSTDSTMLIYNKQQSSFNHVSNLLLFLCNFVDFVDSILITKVSFNIGYKLLNTLLVL